MKLYVDDLRPCPEGWETVGTYEDAVAFLFLHPVEELSLDHDLGHDGTGYDIVKWMFEANIWPKKLRLHTANPVGRKNMRQLIEHYGPYTNCFENGENITYCNEGDTNDRRGNFKD
jgi:hypothetical protein